MSLRQTLIAACALAVTPFLGAVAHADNYPLQGSQTFRAEGVVSMVDADRDRVTITTSDARQYNLDTGDCIIRLRTTSQPGETGDLVSGMHVRISGRLLAAGVVAADTVTVLPYSDDHPADDHPTGPVAVSDEPAPPSDNPSSAGTHIRLRGTVESVDDDAGVVVVHVRDHARTVKIDHHTDLTDIPSPDDDHIGLHPGDRVTVNGMLHADGTVLADAVSLSPNIDAARVNPDAGYKVRETAPSGGDVENDHQIVGRVSHESDKLLSRDIKVQLEPDREITVHVPHDARVLRDGRPISVHELTEEDVVRVDGYWDGNDDFQAQRIDVLRTYQDEQ
jgi:hypothetical protein